MKTTATLLVAAATLAHPVIAGGSANTWSTWTTSKAAEQSPAPEVGWTDWVTTTEYQEKTVTVPGPTTTTTEYDTITVTETPAPVTETKTLPPDTVTETLPPVTETETLPPVTVTEIQTVVSVSGSIATIQNTVVNTVDNTVYNTVVNTAVSVITSVSVATETISSCPTTTSAVLTGLVPCPSRITNTDYSPPTPLPDSYLWGCPPDYLCHPKKVDCNFESNPPALSYICAPEDCLPVAPRPSSDTFLGLEDVNTTCAWLTPVDDYFNINPYYFGLNFNIFKTFGQEECSYTPPPSTPTPPPPAPPPPATTTTTPPPPPPPPPPATTTTTTTIPPPPPPPPTTTTTTTPPPPPPPSSSSSWSVWTSAPAPAPVSSSWSTWGEPSKVTAAPFSSGWNGWSSQAGYASSAEYNSWKSDSGDNHNYGGHVTKRAALIPRQGQVAAVNVIAGTACYAVCNDACGIVQSIGKQSRLCQSDGDFSRAINNIHSCTDRHPADGGVETKVDLLGDALRFCMQETASTAATSAAAQETAPASSPPATPASTSAAPSTPESSPPPATTSAAPPPAATSSAQPPPAATSSAEAPPAQASSTVAATSAAVSSMASSAATSAMYTPPGPSTPVSTLPAQGMASNLQATNSIFTVLLSILAFFVRL